jgi:hypothetical protein
MSTKTVLTTAQQKLLLDELLLELSKSSTGIQKSCWQQRVADRLIEAGLARWVSFLRPTLKGLSMAKKQKSCRAVRGTIRT